MGILDLFKRKKKASNENLLNESSVVLTEKDDLFERNSSYEVLRQRYRSGKVPKLNEAERSVLEFCHNTDMRAFLKDEFERHPIKLDDDGNLIKEESYYKGDKY